MMKKLLCLAVALLCCCLLATVVAAEDTNVWRCAHCNEDVTWEVMPSSVAGISGHKHYYLTKSITPAQLLTDEGVAVTICLDLKGYGIDTNGRTAILKENCTWSIMDSSTAHTGYISGSRGNNNAKGGTFSLRSNARLNLYSGTLTFKMDDEGGQKTNQAAVVWIQSGGEMNIYGGKVKGGELMQNGTATSYGGAISVAGGGKLRVAGGMITSGVLPETGIGPCVYAESSTASVILENDAYVEEIRAAANVLQVKGAFSGQAWLELVDTPTAGMTVGTCESTAITGELFCINGDGWMIGQEGTELKLAAFTPSLERHYCQNCERVVKWDVLNNAACTTMSKTLGAYHYYLSTDYGRSAQISLVANAQACLDLQGNTYSSQGRAMYLNPGATMSIMDSVGGGEVVATTGTNNPTGGVMVVKSNATFNLYGGTLRLDDTYLKDYGVGVGGIVYMSDVNATVNMYGGTIQGADLVMSEYKLTTNGRGAAIYMNSSSRLNVYDGKITAGTLAEGCLGECVYVHSKTAKVTLSGRASVAEIYYAFENDQLTISGEYIGSVRLNYADGITPTENLVVGVSDNADISGADTGCGDQWMLDVSDNSLVLIPSTPVVTIKDGSYAHYATLGDAIDNADGSIVKLIKSVTEDVTVSKDLCLDLNGKTVNGTVTVDAGATLYGMDSQTDDYTINDTMGYGKLKVSGEGKVLGLPEESSLAADGYMMITESDGISFHAVGLKLTAMNLRAQQAGIYYTSNFGGDELVAARVLEYGVALSVVDVPDAKNLDLDCQRSKRTDFVAGGMDGDATSTLLKGVMKTSNATLLNKRNANMPIYGRAYIRTADGVIFGASAQRTFREQVEGANNIWSTLDAIQKTSVVELYDKFKTVMQDWTIDQVIAQKDPSSDGVLKILGIGNSYTQDSMWMLYNIYKAENPDKEIVLTIAYYPGCSLAQHVQYALGNEAEYDMFKKTELSGGWERTNDVTLKTIIESENWDIVTMQQASTYSGVADTYNSDIDTIQTFVKNNLGYTPAFAWNMTWAYPTKDIEGDAFVTVNTNSGFAKYNNDQMTMYNAIVDTVKAKIVPNETFTYLMPTGVGVQNANASYLDDPDLYRDYTHLNDFARVLAAYVWYCELEGVELNELKFTTIPAALTNSYKTAGYTGDMELTQDQINIILEAVRNAMATKKDGTFAVTPSQYTTPNQ